MSQGARPNSLPRDLFIRRLGLLRPIVNGTSVNVRPLAAARGMIKHSLELIRRNGGAVTYIPLCERFIMEQNSRGFGDCHVPVN